MPRASRDDRNAYMREYLKTSRKCIRIPVSLEEFDAIHALYDGIGIKSMSAYIKTLINADCKQRGIKQIFKKSYAGYEEDDNSDN